MIITRYEGTVNTQMTASLADSCSHAGDSPGVGGWGRCIIKRLVSKGNVINVAADPNLSVASHI